jgi:Spy/CpxP family protein refolding chaperone
MQTMVLNSKKMKKLFSILILLTFVLTISAQEQKREIIIKREGMMKANPAHLAPQYTPEQQKQMASFRLTHEKEMIQLDNQLNEKRAQLKTLQQVDKPDLKSIYSKIDEITALQNKKMKETATHQNNVRSILTEEQRIKFDKNQGMN